MADEPVAEGPALIVVGGPTDGYSFALHEGLTALVGSGRLAHLRVGGDEVGSAHVRIAWDENGICLTDNGSATGTFVNGEQVETAVLWDGDQVSFVAPTAKVQPPKIRVRIPPGTVKAPPPAPPEPVGEAAAPAPVPHPVARVGRRTAQPSGGLSLGDFSLSNLSLPSLPSLPSFSGSGISLSTLGYAVGGLVALVGAFLLLQYLFFSKPVITAIQPAESDPGLQVTLSGKRFHEEAGRNNVLFGDQAVPALASTGHTLTVAVPEAPASGGDVSVVVETPRGRSQPVPFRIHTPLRVASLDPEAALPGQEVTARGAGFSEGSATVTVDGKPATVVEARRDGLRFKVPALAGAPGSSVPVLVSVGKTAAKPVDLILGSLPIVLAVEPARGGPGDKVTLKGRGFGSDAAGLGVTIGGVPALVLAASPREIQVLAPNPGLQQVQNEAAVVVRVAGTASTNRAVFLVLRPASMTYILRFFPAAVAEGNRGQAYLATDLGPLFLLASPAGAPSVAERALRAAAALNAAFDRAQAGQPVAFEARPEPVAGLGVAGSPDPLLAATAEDAAANTPAGAPPLTLAALSEHWAALASDLLSVFVKNEKPYRLLTVSPRGRSLSDLRTALGWRGGIPGERIAGLPPELLARLREAALVPGAAEPGKGPGAAAAVEGQWDGEMQDQSAGAKPITVKLRVVGSRLEGTLTNRSQGVTMDVALKDVSFDQGVLKFVLPAGAATRTFVGKAANGSISGTLHATPTGPAVGTFSLHNAP